MYDGTILFKTDKNFKKTQQLFKNQNVAMCKYAVNVEGIAENRGLVVDEPERKFEKLYAIEMMCAAQAIDLSGGERGLSPRTRAAFDKIRKQVPVLDKDKTLYQDINAIAELIEGGEFFTGDGTGGA